MKIDATKLLVLKGSTAARTAKIGIPGEEPDLKKPATPAK